MIILQLDGAHSSALKAILYEKRQELEGEMKVEPSTAMAKALKTTKELQTMLTKPPALRGLVVCEDLDFLVGDEPARKPVEVFLLEGDADGEKLMQEWGRYAEQQMLDPNSVEAFVQFLKELKYPTLDFEEVTCGEAQEDDYVEGDEDDGG